MREGSASLFDFVVDANERVATDIWRIKVRSKVAAALAPGQFVNLAVPGDGSHILRIPLSFSRLDVPGSTVELVYAVVGEGTRRLSRMGPGCASTLVGPCGNGWRLPEGPGRALLVAGGVGLPPVFAAASMLAAAGVGFDVVVGAQSSSRHVDRLVDELRGMPAHELCDCARRVLVTTDDGSLGIRGLTTDAMARLLAERSYAQVYTCGPSAMMAGVARLARGAGIGCQASLERMMGCGFGACSCCNVPLVSGGYALCCQDGPVFDGEEVAW